MTYLGIVLLIVGVVLWLTILPGLGWALVIAGVVLLVVGLLLSAAHRGGPPGSGL